MKIKQGVEYKTRDGRKAKASDERGATIRIEVEGEDFGRYVFVDTGRGNSEFGPDTAIDLISVWVENSPVQSTTVKTIVAGEYSGFSIKASLNPYWIDVGLTVPAKFMSLDAKRLRAAALTFTQLADFLEEQRQ